jgi:hypothetical protein
MRRPARTAGRCIEARVRIQRFAVDSEASSDFSISHCRVRLGGNTFPVAARDVAHLVGRLITCVHFVLGFKARELHFDEIPSHARAIEDLEFDVIHTWDHVDSGPAPSLHLWR